MSINITSQLVRLECLLISNSLESRDLNEFLDLKEEQIMKSGIPSKIYKFLESTYQIISKNGPEAPRKLASILVNELANFNDTHFWASQSEHTKETCHFFIQGFLILGAESVIDVIQPFNFECLGQIHQKILTCIACKMAKDLGIQDQKFVVVPSNDTISTGHAYFKRNETWFVSPLSYSQVREIEPINMPQQLPKPIVDPSNGFKKKFIPMLGQSMFVEKDLSLVTEKRVLIDVTINYTDKRSEKFKFLDIKLLPQGSLPSLIVTITYLNGLPEYDSLKPNCIVFETIIDSETLKPLLSLRLASPNPYLVSMVGLESKVINELGIKALELVEDFKEEWVQEFLSSGKNVQHVISYPKTDLEKKKAFVEILLNLSSDAVKNSDLIEYLFLDLAPSVSLEEFKALATPEELVKLEEGELEPSPQLMSKLLIKEAMNEYKAAMLLAPPESNNNATTTTTVTSAPSVKEEVLQKDKVAQAQVFSNFTKKGKKFRKKEKKIPAKEAPAVAAPTKQFKLTSDEKEKVQAVMQGNPMRSKDFNKFYVKLLKRKMGESKQSTKKDGSHVKLHIEKADGGSTGHTLVRSHGKKDTMGFIGAQKRSLKDLFDDN